MIKLDFSDEWKYWIWSNLKNGVSRERIYADLLSHGFDRFAVIQELKYLPPANADFGSGALASVMQQLAYFGAERLDVAIPMFRVPNFLTADECDGLIDLQRRYGEKSTTGQGPDIKFQKGRDSFSTYYEHNDHTKALPLVRHLKQKVLGLVGLPAVYSEPIQGQWYKPGGFYNDHFDAIEQREKIDSVTGNRTWTCMINLNTPESGGATAFPKLETMIEPMQGQALIWYNLQENDTVHPQSLHAGTEVIAGEKFIVTQWFRQRAKE